MPCVLNAANESAVDAFLQGRIKFTDIYSIIEKAMQAHTVIHNVSPEIFFDVDADIRKFTDELLKKM